MAKAVAHGTPGRARRIGPHAGPHTPADGAPASSGPGGRRLLRLPGVYAPQADTWLLAAALCQEPLGPGTRVLDIGTGTGALALCAARRGARVTAVDVDRRAVAAARLNALLAGVRMTVVRGDLTDGVAPQRAYDVVLSNPPYVPAPGEGSPRGPARAWDAGPDGRAVLDRLCDAAPAVLAPGGVLLLAQSALSGTARTLEQLAALGLDAGVHRRTRIPFGPVLLSRMDWLAARGLIDGDGERGGDGEAPPGELDDRTEELVIIRAVRT